MNLQKEITILTQDVKNLIGNAQKKAIKAVDTGRTLLYWNIGKRIVEELQDGKDRAGYGKQIIKSLSLDLEPVYGIRQLELMRQFYRTFPNTNTLYSQLNWSQCKLIHHDVGQLQMYVNYYDRNEKQDFENATIGVLLKIILLIFFITY